MSHLLLSLDLTGRRVLLVGGGRVGTRRALAFVDAGAAVVVVSPALTDELAALVAASSVEWRSGDYQSTDLAGAWLVHTATGVPEVDARVSADAAAARVFCVDATDASRATAHVPARRRIGGVSYAVHADGDHAAARRAMEELERALGSNPPRTRS